MNPLVIDAVALILFLVLSVGYHVFYATVMRHHRDWSARARMHEHRLHWVEMVAKRGERIMAVQALRNLIMTNTFLASTMILLVAFITQFVVSETGQGFLKRHPEATLATGAMPVQIKAILLVSIYAFAFVMFLTSLRSLNHLTILVAIEPDHIRATENRDPTQFVTRKLNQVENMTTYGRRAVYFSLPVLGWYFSPWVFAVTSVVIWILFVYSNDFVAPVTTRRDQEEKGGDTIPSTPSTTLPMSK